MRIYLDNCCYQRIYDDQTQIKVKLEALAVAKIQEKITYNELELVTSYMLHYENGQRSDEKQRIKIEQFFKTHRKIHISIENAELLEESIKKIMSTGIKVKDATHVASAILSKCDYFITVDERLLKYKSNEIKLVTPIEFIKIMESDGNDS